MNRIMRTVSSCALLGALACLLPQCGSAPKKDTTMTLQEFEQNAPPPDDPCVGQKGAPLECGSQDDCCKGYSCSKDPERNPRALYCIKG
jgi:hypothetical protein